MPRTRYYVAYGSNMNLKQMRWRCPTAELLGTAVMHGWQLLFRGGRNSSVATIERRRGSLVPVMVWRITAGDEKALDRYEGWPHLYRKESVRLYLNGRQIRAMAYIMNEGHNGYGTPGSIYLETVRQGYLDAGFDRGILLDAVEASEKLMEERTVMKNDESC